MQETTLVKVRESIAAQKMFKMRMYLTLPDGDTLRFKASFRYIC